MKTIAISVFRRHCSRVLDEAAHTGRPLLITRRGKPLARLLPVPAGDDASWVGCLRGTIELPDNLITPIVPEEDWEVLRP